MFGHYLLLIPIITRVCFIWIKLFVLCLQPESRKPGSHFETATSTASLFSVDEAEFFNFSDEVSLVFYHHFIARLQSLVHPHNNAPIKVIVSRGQTLTREERVW